MSIHENPVVGALSGEAHVFHLAEEALEPTGVILTAWGELDIATAPRLHERLHAAIDAGATRLLLDLTSVSFIDSVALASILEARKHLGDAGRMAVVIARDSYTRLIFEIAGLPEHLPVFETRAEAGAGLAD
jgi:anti-sigma B factor antagonist